MKKTSLIIALLTTLSLNAQAGINVLVSGLTGFYRSDDTTGLLQAPGGLNGWIQFIYSTTGVVAGPAGIGGTVDGSESILDQFGLTNAGNSDDYGTFVYGLVAPQTTGFWYARLFEGGSSTTGASADNITAGTWYYESAVYAVINNTDPASPDAQSIQGNNPTILQTAFGGDFVNYQVVPEPSVLAFLGLGGLALAARRRFIA